MKIIKNGKRNCGAFKFKCDKCGCKFVADINDYDKIDDDVIRCKCPNCDEELDKNLYEKRIGFKIRPCTIQCVMAVINIVLLIMILIVIPNEPRKEMTGFQIFVSISSIVILMVDAATHMCTWVDMNDN